MPCAFVTTAWFHKPVGLQGEKVLLVSSLSTGCLHTEPPHPPLLEEVDFAVKLSLAKADNRALGRNTWKDSSFWFTYHLDIFQKTISAYHPTAYHPTASLHRCLICLLGPVLDQKALVLPHVHILSSSHYKGWRVL